MEGGAFLFRLKWKYISETFQISSYIKYFILLNQMSRQNHFGKNSLASNRELPDLFVGFFEFIPLFLFSIINSVRRGGEKNNPQDSLKEKSRCNLYF